MKLAKYISDRLRGYLIPIQSQLEQIQINQMKTHLVSLNDFPNGKELHHYEYKCFSQWGDDGIIQYLIRAIDISEATFIEFGVEDFSESNCRFLMMNNNWSGFVIDGSKIHTDNICKKPWYWKFDLVAHNAFVTRENINDLLRLSGFSKDLGIISIDIDGMDYWVFEEVEYSPSIFILEYNSVFGVDRAITVPYEPDFFRTNSHYSNLYFGASLMALTNAANNKGYSLVGCNSAGNNAYYVRNDLVESSGLVAVGVRQAYVASKFREARAQSGQLSYIRGSERLEALRGLPVVNVNDGRIEDI